MFTFQKSLGTRLCISYTLYCSLIPRLPQNAKYVQPGNEATIPPNSHQNVSLPKLLDSWSPTELTFQCDPAFFKLLVTQLLINLQ